MIRNQPPQVPFGLSGVLDAYASISSDTTGEKAAVIAPGFALGKASIFKDISGQNLPKRIKRNQIPEELESLEVALEKVTKYIEKAAADYSSKGETEAADLLDTQLTLLADPSFLSLAQFFIEKQSVSVSFAVTKAIEFICDKHSGHDVNSDRLLYDWTSVKDLILQSLTGEITSTLSSLSEPRIVVHPNPSITDIHSADLEHIQGWVVGSLTAASHVRIMLRDSQVPVLAIEDTNKIPNGSTLALDSLNEVVLINPHEDEIAEFKTLRSAIRSNEEGADLRRVKPSTACGESIRLMGTLNTLHGLKKILSLGAQDVGLARTENLFYLGRKKAEWLDADAQTEQLVKIARKLSPGKLTVRTFDLGADKWDKILGEIPGGSDSKLGLKSVRLALSYPELFADHLSAIIRAQYEVRNIYPMFPMISDLGEFHACKQLLDQQAQALLEGGKISKIPPIKIGAMIENATGVSQIKNILSLADFVSIGWSDLTQNYLCVDRDVQAVSHSFMPHHPAVLDAIKQVVLAAKEVGKDVSICGEIVSHRTYLPVALGLGVRMLTVAADAMPKLNGKLQELYISECEELVNRMIEATTPQEASIMLANFHKTHTAS